MKVHFKEVDRIKIKSELFVFLIIVCILFGVSAVSAGEIHNDTDSDIELNHEVLKENVKYDDNLKAEPVDNNSFTALSNLINKSGEELNITNDYVFNKSLDSKNLVVGSFPQISINQTKIVINGNNHVIDGAGAGAVFSYGNSSGEITINNLIFKNFNLTVIAAQGNVKLNNVTVTDIDSKDGYALGFGYSNAVIDNCVFSSNNVKFIVSGD